MALAASFLSLAAVAAAAVILLEPNGRSEARAETQELVVVATSAHPLQLVKKGRELGVSGKSGFHTIRSEDCANLKSRLYLAALKIGGGDKAARLAEARRMAKDAYPRSCEARPNSLAAASIPAIDPSFAALDFDPLNWTEKDAVARLQNGILVRPYFEAQPEDPLEGLRAAVEVVADGRRRPIVSNCNFPEVAGGESFIAVACATENVVDQPIYQTNVYRRSDLAPVKKVARCRAPAFVTALSLRCTRQVVDSDGRVTETSQTVAL